MAARCPARLGAGWSGVSRVRRRPRATLGQPSGYGGAGKEIRHRRVSLHERAAGRCRTAFFRNRPEMAGVQEGEFTALCTSHPAVRQWMGDALAYVFRQVPDLAGVFTITASENLTNCAVHGEWQRCPQCKSRQRRGNHRRGQCHDRRGRSPRQSQGQGDRMGLGLAAPTIGNAAEIIPRLPKSTWLMSVSEWDLPIERGGIKTSVGEYSHVGRRAGPSGNAALEIGQGSGVKDCRQGAIEQHLGVVDRALPAGDGSRGRALP